jgi:hypothetical protein
MSPPTRFHIVGKGVRFDSFSDPSSMQLVLTIGEAEFVGVDEFI